MRSRLLSLALIASATCKHDAPEGEPEAVPVHVICAPAVRMALDQSRLLRGTVTAAPDRDAIIAPQISGRLVRLSVREGDAVVADQSVAEVESQPMRDGLLQARAQLAQVEATAHNATTAFDRAQHLFDRGIAARQEVDDANARRLEASAAVASARAAVDLAARNLARAVVRSPIAGLVVHIIRRPGELVDGTPATPVLEIADPNALEFLGSASPSDLVVIHSQQHAVVHFDSLTDQSFDAIVRMVSPAIDPTTGLGTVRLVLAANAIRPPFGLFGIASVSVGTRANVVVVPPAAIRNAPSGGSEVLFCDGTHARVRAVELGERTPARVEIIRGIAAGDRVVIEGALGLADGADLIEDPIDGG